MVKGKELFADHNLKLADGKDYKIEFSIGSLMELEDLKDGDFQAVFDMFEKDFNTRNMMYGLWACLITHNEEFEGLSQSEVIKTMKKLISADNFLVIKLTCLESFGAFWKKAKESNQLPDEYKKLFAEMDAKQSKKK